MVLGERRLWRFGIKKQAPWNKVIVEKYRIPGGCRTENTTPLFFLEAWKKFSGMYSSFFLTLVVSIEPHISARLQDFLPEVDDNDDDSTGNKLESVI